jgi:hypothetical protein
VKDNFSIPALDEHMHVIDFEESAPYVLPPADEELSLNRYWGKVCSVDPARFRLSFNLVQDFFPG